MIDRRSYVRNGVLTVDREALALEWIKAFCLARGYPPTIQDLTRTGLVTSNGSAGPLLHRLERRGLLRRLPGKRGMVPAGDGCPFCGCPIPRSKASS
jgi:SOS-response transcriptional repressor LexA